MQKATPPRLDAFSRQGVEMIGQRCESFNRPGSLGIGGGKARSGVSDELIAEYSDDGVKGGDPVDQRPGFAAMLKHIASNGVRTIIVETANRFARDLITQETGWRFLRDAGIALIAADSPDAFLHDTPTAVMIRQILGSVAQFEKAMLVSKLRGARERRKSATGKCEGRKSLSESRPEVVALAKRLSRYPINKRKRSLRDIAAELETQGHVATTGRRYEATAIARMIAA